MPPKRKPVAIPDIEEQQQQQIAKREEAYNALNDLVRRSWGKQKLLHEGFEEYIVDYILDGNFSVETDDFLFDNMEYITKTIPDKKFLCTADKRKADMLVQKMAEIELQLNKAAKAMKRIKTAIKAFQATAEPEK